MKRIKILAEFLLWRAKNVNYRSFVLILSLIVGVLSGLAAVILKNMVHYTSHFLTHWLHAEEVNYIYIVYPLTGIFLTILFIKYFVKDHISHGISKILYAISKKNSLIASHNSYTSMISSILTVGFGGSVGLEAPIVLTGSSIGSNIGRQLGLNYKTITLLIGCGSAGAIAGIFKAPIAAVIFAIEVLMLDLTMWSLAPLLISAVCGATISYFLSGKGFIFSVDIHEIFSLKNLPYYILLGMLSGLVSLYFTRSALFIESRMEKISSPYKKWIIGGALLGFIIFIFPSLYGEGYVSLTAIINGNADALFEGSSAYQLKDNFLFFIFYLLAIVFMKVIATSLTTGSGGVGGIFAPTLFIGGITGYTCARLINVFSFVQVSEKNFALAGMAGVMAGVMHAPLTAIFLIAEITGGYLLFVPLIITSTIAYLTMIRFEAHSIYTYRLAKRGQLITHNKDQAILTRLKMKKVIEDDLIPVKPEQTLRDLVKIITKSKRNLFPVIDDEGTFLGIVNLDNIREIIFNQDMYDSTYVENLMELPPTLIILNEPMEKVMNKFESTGVWNLPVVHEGKYVGFISKSKLFSIYRNRLIDITS